jgi:hypothetical protein
MAVNQVYGHAWSVVFRQHFVGLLLQAGLTVKCGAALPDGPKTQDSECQALGRITTRGLELDHAPALTEAERQAAIQGDRRAVDDPFRVQWLCSDCHRKATARRREGVGVSIAGNPAGKTQPE